MKTHINFGEDYIQITGETEGRLVELAYWDKQEWTQDPEIVFSIANAIRLAKENPDKLLEKLCGKRFPIVSLSHPFDEEELLHLFEFARIAMADADTFDAAKEMMDVKDDYMTGLREKLCSHLGNTAALKGEAGS